jgi:hypothetical protein
MMPVPIDDFESILFFHLLFKNIDEYQNIFQSELLDSSR